MIELPPKFKQALGNGVRTSLYPLVRIYKGVRIDDPEGNNGIAWEDAEQVYLSCKETNIGGSAYKPLLLNTPSIKSSADIVNNKYTISSVSLSISNAPFQGKIFSDDIQSILNAVCQVYYCANGIDSIEDCLLVYTGTIRRFSQSAETIKLELEDATQQILSTKIPSTLIPDDITYKEEDIGKPYPMVYGFVDKSPLVLRASPDPDTGEAYEIISNLIIDKPNQQISGAWDIPLTTLYQNEYIEQTILTSDSIITDQYYLFAYNNGFLPINRIMPDGWTFDYGGDSPYQTNTLDGKILYNVDSDASYGPNIKLSAEAQKIMTQIEQFTDSGIPTRVYKPVNRVGFFAKNGNDSTLTGNYGIDDENKMYGFNNLDTSLWDPRDEIVKSTDIFAGEFIGPSINDDSPAKDEYSRDWGLANPTWWEPTTINELENPFNGHILKWSYKDINWENNKGNGEFPVSYIQNGDDTNNGIHLTSQTYLSYASHPNSGCFVKLMFNEAPSFNCVTRVYYTLTYYQPQNIHESPQFSGTPYFNHLMQPTSLFLNPVLESLDTGFFDDLDDILTNSNKGDIPFHHDVAEDIQVGDDTTWAEGASVKVKGNQISTLFNTTDAFDSIQWGIRDVLGLSIGGRAVQSCVANLHEFYTVQDVLVDDIMNQKFFASVKGRIDTNGNEIQKSSEIIKDILNNELIYDTEIQEANIDDGWIHSFTLNEQKEAKEVFEGLFKSSLIIPSFNAQGQFSFIPLHQVLDNVSYTTIDNQDLLKYSFSLTKLDDVKNSVNVKYKKNYGSGEFDKETGYSLIDADGNEYENLDEITRHINLMFEHKYYNIDYYGLTSEEAKLEVETDYIRDDDTARKLQKRLLMWYANQHLIAKIDLPASYMNLEVGDYIGFNELVGGKKAFGFDYTISQMKNGQIVYPVFFITKISKSLDKINIEAIQVHRGEYGEPDEDIIIDEENIVDGGGNAGVGNWELGDPNDNPNYGDDTIVEEEEEEYTEDPYLNVTWVGGNNDLNTNPQAIINTNIEGEFEYEALIIYNDEIFEYGTNYEMPIITEDDEPYNATDYINVSTYTNTNSEGNIQGGNITLSTPYLIPEEHNGIVGILRISYQGTEYSFEVDFAQGYVVPPVYELGDINGDGIIDILDMVRLVQIILETADEPSDDELSRADINQDGIVNIGDIISLVQLLLTEGGEVEEQPT